MGVQYRGGVESLCERMRMTSFFLPFFFAKPANKKVDGRSASTPACREQMCNPDIIAVSHDT